MFSCTHLRTCGSRQKSPFSQGTWKTIEDEGFIFIYFNTQTRSNYKPLTRALTEISLLTGNLHASPQKHSEKLPVTLHLWKRAVKNIGLIISPVWWWMAGWGRSAGKVSVWFGRRRRESLRGHISLWSVCWFHLSECRSAALLPPLWWHRPRCRRRRRNTVWGLGTPNQHTQSTGGRTLYNSGFNKRKNKWGSKTWNLLKGNNSCVRSESTEVEMFFLDCWLFIESIATGPGFLLVQRVTLMWPDLTLLFF